MSGDDPIREPARRAEDPGGPTATLEEVDIRRELLSRPYRPPDYEAENRALAVLAREMAENPRNVLQKLVETALELCNAGTAGISLLEGAVFRWEALTGVFASHRNSTMPREASPCGVCIDRNATQLMHLADRHFPALRAEPRFVEALLIPFHDRGEPVGTVWVVTHDDERKFDREDERIIRVLGQFASAGWQLWKTYEAAAESSRRKDEFLAMLGHELRNPLAAIVSASAVLQKRGPAESSITYAVEVVARQAQHLSRLVDDLLDLSRISRATLELHREPVELSSVVAHAVETLRALIERRGHRLFVEVAAEPIRLEADPVRLSQMLSNLLDNAAKYTPEGGSIWLTAELVGGDVRITVRDTGIGIPSGQLEGIFDLFARLGRPSESASEGFGLGLTLVRTLAELHGGSVEATSAGPGQGSQFTVRLPILPTSEQNDQVPEELDVRTPRRVLLVEDNDDVAQSLGITLALDGHAVSVAQEGRAALEMLRTFEPDVVLLDLGLPGMSGYEVARRMREEGERPELVIVAVSGYGHAEDRRRSAESGCDEHLVKPIDPDALRRLLGGAPRSGGGQASR